MCNIHRGLGFRVDTWNQSKLYAVVWGGFWEAEPTFSSAEVMSLLS